jgi:hypothetical protein
MLVDARCQMPDAEKLLAGCWPDGRMLADAGGCHMLDAGCWMLKSGCHRMLSDATGCYRMPLGCRDELPGHMSVFFV